MIVGIDVLLSDLVRDFVLFFNATTTPGTWPLVLIVLLGGIVVYIATEFTITINETEVVIIESFGKFSRKLGPGLHFVPFKWPKNVYWAFKESENSNALIGYKIPTNVQVYNPVPYTISSEDNLEVVIDLIVQFKIVDAKKAVYAMDNIYANFESELRTYMVNLVRSMRMTDISVASLTTGLNLENLNQMFLDIGMCITSIRVEKIDYPEAVSSSLQKVNHNRIKQDAFTRNLASESDRLRAEAEIERQRASNAHIEREIKHNNKLKMKREAWLAKKTQLLEKQQLQLEFEEKRAQLFDKYAGYAEYQAAALNAKAWTEIASSPSTRLIMAPETALASLGNFQTVKMLNAE